MTWAPMSPPVGVLVSNTRLRCTTFKTENVVPPTMINAVR